MDGGFIPSAGESYSPSLVYLHEVIRNTVCVNVCGPARGLCMGHVCECIILFSKCVCVSVYVCVSLHMAHICALCEYIILSSMLNICKSVRACVRAWVYFHRKQRVKMSTK